MKFWWERQQAALCGAQRLAPSKTPFLQLHRTKPFLGDFVSFIREYLPVILFLYCLCFFHVHFEQPSALYPAFPRISAIRYLCIHQEMPLERTLDRQTRMTWLSFSLHLFKLETRNVKSTGVSLSAYISRTFQLRLPGCLRPSAYDALTCSHGEQARCLGGSGNIDHGQFYHPGLPPSYAGRDLAVGQA